MAVIPIRKEVVGREKTSRRDDHMMKLFQDLQPVLAKKYWLTFLKKKKKKKLQKPFSSKLANIFLQELVRDLETVSSCSHLYVKFFSADHYFSYRNDCHKVQNY